MARSSSLGIVQIIRFVLATWLRGTKWSAGGPVFGALKNSKIKTAEATLIKPLLRIPYIPGLGFFGSGFRV